MNKRKQKKYRKKLYKNLIEDVALEISLDSKWREKIFNLSLNKKIEISYVMPLEIPESIKKETVNNKLKFSIMRVNSCEEHFDDGLEIFKFQSKEYPEIVRFTGNNPNVL